MLNRISIIECDITAQPVDVIVNAANTSLLGGGGVDGAIHRGAGPKLVEECRGLGGCETGAAKITGAYDLPARWVVHTVGPVWRGRGNDEDALLASCYRNSLALAERHEARSIAFPSISTGVYGFPVARAARIAVSETVGFLRAHDLPETVIFACFGRDAFDCHQAAVADIVA